MDDADNAEKMMMRSLGYSGYDSSAAITYADTYWHVPNLAYHYEGDDCDCANYVSQCLYAGGVQQVPGTYSTGWYAQSDSNSLAWCQVSSFDSFWTSSGHQVSKLTAKGTSLYRYACIPGNPIYWLNSSGGYSGHLMIHVGYNTAYIPTIDCHSSWAYHMPISNYYYDSNNTMRTLYTLTFKVCSHINYTNFTFQGTQFVLCNDCGSVYNPTIY